MAAEPDFDEGKFFAAIGDCGCRALLIGRRALIAIGLPVATVDYDFWLHLDDIELFNAALEPMGFAPSYSPAEARARGRYVLADGEHVDVLVARSVPTIDGIHVRFDDVWARRDRLALGGEIGLHVPCLDDLIATKKFGARPRDLQDIRLLEALRGKV